MKTFFAVLVALISTPAFADSASSIDVGGSSGSDMPQVAGTSEVVGYDTELDQGEKSYAVEVGFDTLGDYGNQSYKNFSNTNGRSSSNYLGTDGMLSITVRKAFSTSFDLSISGTLLNQSATSVAEAPGDSYVQVSVKPISFGARYHLSYFSDAIRPFGQVDLGEAEISETAMVGNGAASSAQSVGESDDYFRSFAKFTLGSDFFITPRLPIYIGVKVGYLVMSEFGGFTTGLNLGYAF